MTIDLVCVGACYLDTILTVPHYPDEDEKLRATNLQVRRGGNCPNTLEVLQQLLRGKQEASACARIKPYILTCLPSRNASTTASIIASYGTNALVDFSTTIFRDDLQEPASCYVLRSEATGTRTSVNFNQMPDMTFEEFVSATKNLGDTGWFHFEGRTPVITLQCIRWLRQSKPKARVSVEIEKPGREGLEELAADADVVFYSRSWAESKLYESAEQCLRAQVAVARKARLLFCTWGSQGASCLSLPAGNLKSCPPGRILRVVDTVGAGDTFIAGVLFCLCYDQIWSDQAILGFAVELASSKIQQEGFGGLGYKELRRLEVAPS
ncbi:Ribokinase-like protein [Xylariaceae sp. FL0255]|nr:Ribokinase-like protein [Xylariaceae sp. FL0255]